MKTRAVRAPDCGHPTDTGPCRRPLTAGGTCGITHRRGPSAPVASAAARYVAATDPMTHAPQELALAAADALDTVGRWHPDFATDVLDALDASGASSTESEAFCDWVSRTGGIDHQPVPFGRVVVSRSASGSGTTVWVDAGRSRFHVRERDGGIVEVVPVGADGRPRVAGPHVVDGGLADGIAYGMRRRPRR